MTDFDENRPTPTDDLPVTAEPTPTPAEEPTASAEETPAPTEEAPAPTPEEGTTPAAPPLYRWTYADQLAHDSGTAAGKSRRNGALIYAIVMTGVFLVSFGLLLAVLFVGGAGSSGPLLRPGISTDIDDEAVEGVERAKHSVVVIEVKTENGGGTGTGIVMTADGYIATNHHVIDGATAVKVTFYDGTVVAAEVIGSSEMDDLGVIKVARNGLVPAVFAHSDECYVGQNVYAIGTPAGPDFAWTTTRGIISYKDREVKIYDDEDGTLLKKLRLLQTDAMVNPGNSGGPLINTKGEVVGVVSMKLSEGYEGIGFAIPSDGAVEILEAIKRDGHAGNVDSSLSHKRPMLGITGVFMDANVPYQILEDRIQALTPEEAAELPAGEVVVTEVAGIYVMAITPGMDAADKLQPGDIITAVQGIEITSMNDLMSIVNDYYAGDTVTLTVYRGTIYSPVDIVLSAQPDSKT